jgi:hypothetical protein
MITKNKNFVKYQKCLSTNSSCNCDTFLNEGLKDEVKKMNIMAYYYCITPEATKYQTEATKYQTKATKYQTERLYK